MDTALLITRWIPALLIAICVIYSLSEKAGGVTWELDVSSSTASCSLLPCVLVHTMALLAVRSGGNVLAAGPICLARNMV